MKNAIRNRNRIADSISQAADAARDADLRRELRGLLKEVMSDHSEVSDEKKDAELQEIAQTLIGFAREGQAAVANIAMERMRALLASRSSAGGKEEKRVGLFGKIKQTLGGKPKESATDAARSAADATLYKLEQEIELISGRRQKEVDKLREIIKEAAAFKPDSYEYKHARARAGSVKQQIKLYEGQIDAHFKALMNNQRYMQLIDNGLAMKNLAALVPDPAEADAILDELSADVEAWQDKQDAFSDVVGDYGSRISRATGTLDLLDDEFDQAVAELRGEAAKPEAAPAAPEAPQPAAAAPLTEPPAEELPAPDDGDRMEEEALDGNP